MFPERQYKVGAAHKKQSETINICKFCILQFHMGSRLKKYHSMKSYWTVYLQFLMSLAQLHNLVYQTVK